jgi:hypothetical protein
MFKLISLRPIMVFLHKYGLRITLTVEFMLIRYMNTREQISYLVDKLN